MDFVVSYTLSKMSQRGGGTYTAAFPGGVFDWGKFLDVTAEVGAVTGRGRGLVTLSRYWLSERVTAEGRFKDWQAGYAEKALRLAGAPEKFRSLPAVFKPFTEREYKFQTDFR